MTPTPTQLRTLLMDLFEQDGLKMFLGDVLFKNANGDEVSYKSVNVAVNWGSGKETSFGDAARELDQQGFINADLHRELRKRRQGKASEIDRVFRLSASRDDEDESARNWIRVKVSQGTVTITTWKNTSAHARYALDPLQEEVARVLRQLIGEGRYGDVEVSRLVGKILYGALFSKTPLDSTDPSPRQLYETEVNEINRSDVKRGIAPPLLVRLDFRDSNVDDLPWEHLRSNKRNLSTDFRLLLTRLKESTVDRSPPLDLDLLPKIWFVTCHPPEIAERMLLESGERSKRPGLESGERSKRPGQESVASSGPEGFAEHLGKMLDDLQKNDSTLTKSGSLPSPVTKQMVGEMLEAESPDVVHYIGHGRIHREKPAIALMSDDGREIEWTNATEFAELLGDFPPRLVILQVQQGELDSLKLSFGEFAPELIDSGVDAVVAMHFPVSRQKAGVFMESFYGDLCNGRSVEAAVQTARAKIYDATGKIDHFYGQFASPMLFVRDGEGFSEMRLVELTTPVKEGEKQPEVVTASQDGGLQDEPTGPDDDSAGTTPEPDAYLGPKDRPTNDGIPKPEDPLGPVPPIPPEEPDDA